MILASGNESTLYGRANIDGLLKARLETGGAWTRFYRPRDREEVAERTRRRAPAPA